jgi:kynurenine formamidase
MYRDHPFPDTREGVLALLKERRNWGRWGDDDELGAINLITPDRVLAAARAVRRGQVISLSRPFPSEPSPANRKPADHFVMAELERGTGGAVMDFVSVACHGITTTHLDALCHVWDEEGMWGGRDPRRNVRFNGVGWSHVGHWFDKLVTRGVLVDIPGLRGCDYVEQNRPVHGHELGDALARQEVAVEPGDALVVYSGREAWSRAEGEYGATTQQTPGSMPSTTEARPGLHASCLEFIRDSEASLLVWDMMDLTPNGYDLAWAVHAAIWAFGVGLVDNALIEPLAEACRSAGQFDFSLTVAPLRIEGGTGSPVNPIAVL